MLEATDDQLHILFYFIYLFFWRKYNIRGKIGKYRQNLYIFLYSWSRCWICMQTSRNYPVYVVIYLAFTIQLSFTTSGVNITTALTTCTREEQRVVIQCLWAEGVGRAEIHRMLSAQCGDSVLRSEAFINGLACHRRRMIRAPIHTDYWTSPHSNF
jgi:hypothetical protein